MVFLTEPDAVVVGSGPNGLAAAVTLARAGLDVCLREAAATPGGGLRSAALFDTDVTHDVCSAVHPLAAASRFFREFDLRARGVGLLQPEIGYAHPLADGQVGLVYRSLHRTCRELGADGENWRRFMGPLLRHSTQITDLMLSNQRSVPRDPRAPFWAGLRALEQSVERTRFGPVGGALLAGVAAHAKSALPSVAGGGVLTLLAHLAHATGWPLPVGGSYRIADALLSDFTHHGGRIVLDSPVRDIRELAESRLVVLDMSPTEFSRIAGEWFPPAYRRWLSAFHYGPGVAKVDFLVSEPIPWTRAELGRAGTVHLGGARADVFASARRNAAGLRPTEPFVLLSEPANTDGKRGHPGKYPVWAYCHVPNGDTADMTRVVQERVERFAPGFADTVLHANALSATELDAHNPNYVGGDIGCGAVTLRQMLFRPAPRLVPHSTPLRGVYLCSAATPPGPAVHGMGGYHAACQGLRSEFGISEAPSLAP